MYTRVLCRCNPDMPQAKIQSSADCVLFCQVWTSSWTWDPILLEWHTEVLAWHRTKSQQLQLLARNCLHEWLGPGRSWRGEAVLLRPSWSGMPVTCGGLVGAVAPVFAGVRRVVLGVWRSSISTR